MKSLSRVRLFVTPWTAAHQAPLSMGLSRQEYWSGVSLPSPLKTHKNTLFFFIYIIFFFLAPLHGMWDLSFLTRNQTRALCIGSTES